MARVTSLSLCKISKLSQRTHHQNSHKKVSRAAAIAALLFSYLFKKKLVQKTFLREKYDIIQA